MGPILCLFRCALIEVRPSWGQYLAHLAALELKRDHTGAHIQLIWYPVAISHVLPYMGSIYFAVWVLLKYMAFLNKIRQFKQYMPKFIPSEILIK